MCLTHCDISRCNVLVRIDGEGPDGIPVTFRYNIESNYEWCVLVIEEVTRGGPEKGRQAHHDVWTSSMSKTH